MQVFTNPLIWLYRFRHRNGYGVHSPFAFRVVNEVVYECWPYYAFAEQDKELPLWWKFRRRKTLHMMFRLANMMQPQSVSCPGNCFHEAAYIRRACPHAEIRTEGKKADLVILSHPSSPLPEMQERSVAVMMNLKENRPRLREMGANLTMDLYDVGLAFWDQSLTPTHYKINF